MLPGLSSSHLSAPVCSALPSPPSLAPVVPALLDLLRGVLAGGSAQDEIPVGDPTTMEKERDNVNGKSTRLGVRMLGLNLAFDLGCIT